MLCQTTAAKMKGEKIEESRNSTDDSASWLRHHHKQTTASKSQWRTPTHLYLSCWKLLKVAAGSLKRGQKLPDDAICHFAWLCLQHQPAAIGGSGSAAGWIRATSTKYVYSESFYNSVSRMNTLGWRSWPLLTFWDEAGSSFSKNSPVTWARMNSPWWSQKKLWP